MPGPGSRVRRFTFRTDGFVSLHAEGPAGEMVTRPLRFDGKSCRQFADGDGGSPAGRNPGCGRAAVERFGPGRLQTRLTGDAIDSKSSGTGGSDVSVVGRQDRAIAVRARKCGLYALQFVR